MSDDARREIFSDSALHGTVSFGLRVSVCGDDVDVELSFSHAGTPHPSLIYSDSSVRSVPRSLFANDEAILEWARVLSGLYSAALLPGLYSEAGRLLDDQVLGSLGALGALSVTPNDIIENHLRAAADELRERYKVSRGKGRPSLWTKTQLLAVTRAALAELPPARRTLTEVHKKIARRQPARAPSSPDSLGKLYRSLDIDFRAVKRQAAIAPVPQKRKKIV